MNNILVTGANGQLGSELRKLFNLYNSLSAVFTDIGELDVKNRTALEDYFTNHSFDFVINCSAYNAVDKAESDEVNAMKLNATACGYLAEQSIIKGFKLIHISTDFVFDGTQNIPYKETDIPAPTSKYAASKLAGEEMIKAHLQNYLIIRTSWLYSSFGNNFVKSIINKGREKGELNVVYDQVGTPTNAADLASVILRIIQDKGREASGLYHFSNEGVASWYDFAKEIISMAGVKCKVNPVLTSQYSLPAKRPAYSVLDKSKIKNAFGLEIPYWKDSLQKCIPLILQNES